ncbi:MAG: quinolinate synthase [Gemmatimonadetes bacterium 13_1_20CM_4_66_11]|nr:MAG: quinolinate synthase [Gemmatimonadetes bacterium 13_1_40CM_3_66_12]OLD88181.1 MAG: quinolinate synthase [Gemmatimonadetes bacterium 13_1_20CM_4_66_11]
MGASTITSPTRDLLAEIDELRITRRAAILAHNYQRPEIQDLADVVADSLQMARRATELDAPILVICGVHFMAETAAIANPDKRILIPDRTAGCSLAATIQAADVRAWRTAHPDGVVVAYVNTAADVKAEADYCCTSGNAVAVIRALPPDVPVLFLPDVFLGNYLRKVTGRQLDVWMGECHVHAGLTREMLEQRRVEYPDAEFLVHPECGCVTSAMYYAETEGDVAGGRTQIVSTEQMMRRARVSPARRFVVATETGVLHRLRRENPGKEFVAAREGAECRYMKQITLENLRDSLRDLQYEVTVAPEIAVRARRAIDRMLAIG